jgi:hypothetical protein
MGFVRIDGLPGQVFVPGSRPGEVKKHPCPDCHHCQMCGEERCRACRSQPEKGEVPNRHTERI